MRSSTSKSTYLLSGELQMRRRPVLESFVPHPQPRTPACLITDRYDWAKLSQEASNNALKGTKMVVVMIPEGHVDLPKQLKHLSFTQHRLSHPYEVHCIGYPDSKRRRQAQNWPGPGQTRQGKARETFASPARDEVEFPILPCSFVIPKLKVGGFRLGIIRLETVTIK